jgi:hypothetical protein
MSDALSNGLKHGWTGTRTRPDLAVLDSHILARIQSGSDTLITEG